MAYGTDLRISHVEREPAVLYDNHHPKGHHRHFRGIEAPYEFQGVDRLIEDFRADIARLRGVKQ